ncbi:MAG: O-antigen ligase family protein [Allosphingosinicella sp.]|uniref:O-antigen ligase family protein n=1 Tax=Allosphingosinicella sp. TaxID=2823234 RepID=UPI003963DF50
MIPGARARRRRSGAPPAADGGVERQRLLFWIVAGWLAVIALGGGTARGDAQSLLFVRPATVLFLAALVLIAGRSVFEGKREALWFIAAMFGLVGAQLVPLPPGLWALFSGREIWAEGIAAAGLTEEWRPFTLSPGGTRNALMALLVPLAAFLGASALGPEWRARLLTAILILICVSALLGMLQIAAGAGTVLRFYRITNEGDAVGLFANRNHNALVIALGFPLLAYKARERAAAGRDRGFDGIILGALSLFLLVSIAVTGSRSGFAIAFLALAASAALFYPLNPPMGRRSGGRRGLHWLVVGSAGAIAAAGLATLLADTRSVGRLFGTSLAEDTRVLIVGELDRMLAAFLPWGSGFGSFRYIFPAFERQETMESAYVNHAHNDLVQIGIEGGAAAVVLLLLFLYWWLQRAWRASRARHGAIGDQMKVAIVCTGGLLVASLVEFPLRTPTMAALFAIFCALLLEPYRRATAEQGGELGLDRTTAAV